MNGKIVITEKQDGNFSVLVDDSPIAASVVSIDFTSRPIKVTIMMNVQTVELKIDDGVISYAGQIMSKEQGREMYDQLKEVFDK